MARLSAYPVFLAVYEERRLVKAADGMDVASAKTIYSQGAKADYLAGYHMKKKVADCSTCHPNDKVTDA